MRYGFRQRTPEHLFVDLRQLPTHGHAPVAQAVEQVDKGVREPMRSLERCQNSLLAGHGCDCPSPVHGLSGQEAHVNESIHGQS